MKRKWWQWEKIVKIEVPCDTCAAKKFREEFNEQCMKAWQEKHPVFVGIINLPDGTSREVFIALGNKV